MSMAPVAQLQSASLASQIKLRAVELGFDLVGICPAEPSRYQDYYRQWISSGQAGSMRYLEARLDERLDVARYFAGAKSVICVAMNYHVPLAELAEEDRRHHGRVARYALGHDYHVTIKSRLHALADWLREVAPDAETRACVDTAPVMEKELAQRAGIGWIGKNTCLLNERIGSWLLLGEIITTLELGEDEPATDHCGSCTRCIDACPTAAITAPYQLDARKCISYLNIESRDAISPELQPLIGEWLYGCDICQDVCPHNRRAPATTEPTFQPRWPSGTLDLREVQRWTATDYQAALKGSAMKRVKLPILQRNAQIVLDNLRRGGE
jgi:epoxyqueuosine reductase